MNFKNILTDPIFKLLEESVNEIGLKSYIVGGFVRDLLIKKLDTKDIDIVVVGSGIELAKKVKNKLNKSSKIQIYKSYGTAMLKSKNLTLEFVGSRKESYSMKSRNPEISFGTLNEDLERREESINNTRQKLAEQERANLTREYYRLYREHPHNSTFVSNEE